jgi:SAM-dependent methyltransferase
MNESRAHGWGSIMTMLSNGDVRAIFSKLATILKGSDRFRLAKVNRIMNQLITELDVEECFSHLTLPFGSANDIYMEYHKVFIRRYSNTINAIESPPPCPNVKALELAASPYGMTALLYRFRFSNLELASFGSPVAPEQMIKLIMDGQEIALRQKSFNAEVDRWPYDAESFDWIISCEMIEHLAMDPMHVFAEANRILKLGGRLVVSTPNASSFQNILKIFSFTTASLCPHYRLPSTVENIYQRHNRELTPTALTALFESGGFSLERKESVNNYPLWDCELETKLVEDLCQKCSPMDIRGDTLNFVGVKIGSVVDRYPNADSLYLASDLKTLGIR